MCRDLLAEVWLPFHRSRNARRTERKERYMEIGIIIATESQNIDVIFG